MALGEGRMLRDKPAVENSAISRGACALPSAVNGSRASREEEEEQRGGETHPPTRMRVRRGHVRIGEAGELS